MEERKCTKGWAMVRVGVAAEVEVQRRNKRKNVIIAFRG